MDNILRIGGIALCSAAMILLIRQTRAEFAPAVTAVSGILLLTYSITTLGPLAVYIKQLTENTAYSTYIGVLLKSLGITLAASTVSDICRDMGESSTGAKVELAAKAEIMLLSMPLVERMVELCTELLML